MSAEAAAIFTIAVRALMLGAGAFAIWSICRDVRRAWPQIVELFTQEDPEDDDA